MGIRKDGTRTAGNPHLSFRVTTEIKSAAERVAKKKNIDRSTLIKQALIKELRANGEMIEEE